MLSRAVSMLVVRMRSLTKAMAARCLTRRATVARRLRSRNPSTAARRPPAAFPRHPALRYSPCVCSAAALEEPILSSGIARPCKIIVTQI